MDGSILFTKAGIMPPKPEPAKIIDSGDSVEFHCLYCEEPVMAGFETICGTCSCPACHRDQPVPPVPCRYREECDGFYASCGGTLTIYVAGGYEGKPDYYIFCDECGEEYPWGAAPETCTRILCGKCKRAIR